MVSKNTPNRLNRSIDSATSKKSMPATKIFDKCHYKVDIRKTLDINTPQRRDLSATKTDIGTNSTKQLNISVKNKKSKIYTKDNKTLEINKGKVNRSTVKTFQ